MVSRKKRHVRTLNILRKRYLKVNNTIKNKCYKRIKKHDKKASKKAKFIPVNTL